MTKAQIAERVAKETGIDTTVVLTIINSTHDNIIQALGNGRNVFFRGFGSFTVIKRAKKVGRNINEKTSINIPACSIPKFKPAPLFKAVVQKGNPVK